MHQNRDLCSLFPSFVAVHFGCRGAPIDVTVFELCCHGVAFVLQLFFHTICLQGASKSRRQSKGLRMSSRKPRKITVGSVRSRRVEAASTTSANDSLSQSSETKPNLAVDFQAASPFNTTSAHVEADSLDTVDSTFDSELSDQTSLGVDQVVQDAELHSPPTWPSFSMPFFFGIAGTVYPTPVVFLGLPWFLQPPQFNKFPLANGPEVSSAQPPTRDLTSKTLLSDASSTSSFFFS